MASKNSNLIFRTSDEWKKELQKVCRNKGRTMTGHIEHSIRLAQLVTEFFDGNDDLHHVSQELARLKMRLNRPTTDIPLAAETAEAVKLPVPKKTDYKKRKVRRS